MLVLGGKCMWRLINFIAGVMIGIVVGAILGLLVTPQSGNELKNLFQKEFEAKKAEIEAQFFRLSVDE